MDRINEEDQDEIINDPEEYIKHLEKTREEWKQHWYKAHEAFKPVMDWYDADGREHDFAKMIGLAVADLQADRKRLLELIKFAQLIADGPPNGLEHLVNWVNEHINKAQELLGRTKEKEDG